jgi:hypothetical protein
VHLLTAITRSRWHQYKRGDEGPFPGATALCGMQDSTSGSGGLINWGVTGSLETYERVLRDTQDWEQARREAAAWPDKARDLGSDVHTAVDQFNRGLPLEITNETAPYVAHYAAWLRNAGVEILASEFFTINAEIGFGGTLDAIARIDGELCLVDWKTGKAKDSQRLQLAGLSMAEWYGDKGKDAEPMPKIETAYIALLRPDSAPELIRHDITDDDREHFRFLVETYHRVRGWAKAYAPTPVQIKEEAA